MGKRPLCDQAGSDDDRPLVGIFWGVRDASVRLHLVTQTTPYAQGEAYGEFLTHPHGHHEAWEAWRPLGPAGLARLGLPRLIVWHEYEYFPRGRVVFHGPTEMFTLYADRTLQDRITMERIVAAFRLTRARYEVRSDAHYRSGFRP